MSLMDSPAALPRLWSRFQAGKVSRDEIDRHRVLQRWQRCREAGLSADNPGEPVMQLDSLAAAIENFAPLLAPGAPFEAFATEMARAGFCGLFCDANGVIVAKHIAEPFRVTSVRTRLIEGAEWSERARGTNGVGTTLAECKPVGIVGAEHYERRSHVLACFAAPIRDIRNRVVAVLDASGPATSASPYVQASVTATAAALEALIVARTYDAAVRGGLFELERLLSSLPHATLLVESTGHVRRANARFRGLLPAALSSAIARRVQEHFAAERGDGSGPPRELPELLNGYRLEIEPLGLEADPFAALVHLRTSHSATRPAATAPRSSAFAGILGSDPALAAARSRAERFAGSDLPVLLLGETGAGKETLARAIHAGSRRAEAPFIAVHSGEGAEGIESELFGESSGPAGRLAAAHGGTLFLDEVAELTAGAQAMLLHFLEDGAYRRAGEAAERRADVRLIAASRRDLPAMVAVGRFRSDLYFRMRGVVLRLPALRDRLDRRELALALLERLALAHQTPKSLGFSRAALDWIEQQPWPGNVRELRTALEHALVLAGDAPRVERWHLPVDEAERSQPAGDLRAAAEREAVVRALEQARGNLSDASRSLGVARSTLYRMLVRHGLRAGEGEAKT